MSEQTLVQLLEKCTLLTPRNHYVDYQWLTSRYKQTLLEASSLLKVLIPPQATDQSASIYWTPTKKEVIIRENPLDLETEKTVFMWMQVITTPLSRQIKDIYPEIKHLGIEHWPRYKITYNS